jgi:hypothetical protein
MKVVPSSSMTVMLNDAIEFARRFSMNSPTWRANCQYFTGKPT